MLALPALPAPPEAARSDLRSDGTVSPRPTRILLRSPKDPFEVVTPEQAFRHNLIGTNAGNLVFLQATWKILGVPAATITPDRLHVTPRRADEINERFDVYVLPLANALRPSFEDTLIQLTSLIRRLRIPVVILGVGAQGTLSGDMERLRPIEQSVRAFVSAVLDRGPSIGVRGELTAGYLRSLGYRDVDAIGCPSMFLNGPDLHVSKPVPELGPDAAVALSVSPYVKAMGPIVAEHVDRYPRLVYIAQDLDTLGRLLWGEFAASGNDDHAMPVRVSHPLFAQRRVRFYVEPWPWIDDLRGMDFAFGSRIHGTIAALLAGTPAVVLAHDSRTLELARHFGIPHRPLTGDDAGIDAARLYEEADYASLNEGHQARFDVFADYLRRHGLTTVFADGDGGRAFDERLEQTPFPGAVDGTDAPRHGRLASTAERARHLAHTAIRSGRVRRLRVTALRMLERPPGRDADGTG